MDRKITWSYGGGRQSIAILLLIKQGKLPVPDYTLMSDTGREKSSTWEYHYKYIQPIIDEIGMKFEIISNTNPNLRWNNKKSTLLIPAFTEKGMGRTFCSSEWKKYPVRRYLRKLGYGTKKPITTWIGISLDEAERMKPSGVKWQEYYWPLIYDAPMNKNQCIQLVENYGLPTPPRSSCYICPHMEDVAWINIKNNYPVDWANAIKDEDDARIKENVFFFDCNITLHQVNELSDNWKEELVSIRKQRTSNQINKNDFCDSGLCFV